MEKADKNRNLVAALAYLLGFITGIVIFLVEKDDKYVRFHAMQSIVIFGVLFGFNLIVSLVLAPLGILSFLGTTINVIVSIIGLIVWIVSMVKAYQGEMYKWPIVGDFAEKQVK